MIDMVGVGGVAKWCGVKQETVSKWLERFPREVPQPDGRIGALLIDGEHERRFADLGWFPERRQAWEFFHAGVRDGSVSGLEPGTEPDWR